MISTKIGDSTTVSTWLDSLDESQKNAWTQYARNASSEIEAYLYARFLKPGYDGSISDVTAWIQEKYPKIDHKKTLLVEIDKLTDDIDQVRAMCQQGTLDYASAATKLSALQKELRSHIITTKSFQEMSDKRGLILAGADRAIRELTQTLDHNPGLQSFIEEAAIIVWNVIETEEKT